ncbi:hypothetical protein Tco_1433172 [Tanacetum coccineum]
MHDKDEVSALALRNVHANCLKAVEKAKDSLSEIKKFNTLVVKFLEEQVIRKKSKENVNASKILVWEVHRAATVTLFLYWLFYMDD